MQPPYKVELSNPKKTVLVEVMKATAAISVVEDYKMLGKLNLRELSMIGDDDNDKEKGAAGSTVGTVTEVLTAEPVPHADAKKSLSQVESDASKSETLAAHSHTLATSDQPSTEKA